VLVATEVSPAQPANVEVQSSQVKGDVPDASLPQLPNHKVKVKLPLQRSCNEKDAKGKICGGHLKRWFYALDSVERACGDLERAWGKQAEVYRCQHCRTLYLPNPQEPRGRIVAGVGRVSLVGLPTGAPGGKAEA
jgi:hypothetical protein